MASNPFSAGLGIAPTPAIFKGDVNPITPPSLPVANANIGGLSPAQLLAAVQSNISKYNSAAKVPALGGVPSAPAAGSSPGMGTYGNSLPAPGNQGNPTAPSAAQAQAIGRRLAAQVGWTGPQWDALNNVAMRESGWNANAVNKSSGAAGIPQALGHGNVFRLGDAVSQIKWMLNYIQSRYGTPAAAWQHELSQGWY